MSRLDLGQLARSLPVAMYDLTTKKDEREHDHGNEHKQRGSILHVGSLRDHGTTAPSNLRLTDQLRSIQLDSSPPTHDLRQSASQAWMSPSQALIKRDLR